MYVGKIRLKSEILGSRFYAITNNNGSDIFANELTRLTERELLKLGFLIQVSLRANLN